MRPSLRWLSPFPAGVEHPWRYAWVYAAHGVRRELRSLWFWLGALGLPVVFFVAGVVAPLIVSVGDAGVPDDPRPLFQVVSTDAQVRDVVQGWLDDDKLARADFRLTLTDDRPQGAHVLRLQGAPPHTRATVSLASAEGGAVAHEAAEHVLRGLRRHAVVSDEELARAYGRSAERSEDTGADVGEVAVPDPDPADQGAPEPEDPLAPAFDPTRDLDVFARKGGAVVAGLGAVFGLLFGLGVGQRLSLARKEGFFGMLRLGTPASVLYVGGILERTILGVVGMLPWLLLFGALVAALVLWAGLVRPDLLTWLLLTAPALAGLAGLGGYLAAAALGTVMGAVQRGQAGAAMSGLLTPVLFLGAWPAWQLLTGAEGVGRAALMLVPVLGVTAVAEGLVDGTPWPWLVLAVLAQAAAAVASVRVGSWAYGVEDGLLDDLRRRLR